MDGQWPAFELARELEGKKATQGAFMEHFDKYFVESTRKITRHLYKGDPREIYDTDHDSDKDSCTASKLKDKEVAAMPKKGTSGKRGEKTSKTSGPHKKSERAIYNLSLIHI